MKDCRQYEYALRRQHAQELERRKREHKLDLLPLTDAQKEDDAWLEEYLENQGNEDDPELSGFPIPWRHA